MHCPRTWIRSYGDEPLDRKRQFLFKSAFLLGWEDCVVLFESASLSQVRPWIYLFTSVLMKLRSLHAQAGMSNTEIFLSSYLRTWGQAALVSPLLQQSSKRCMMVAQIIRTIPDSTNLLPSTHQREAPSLCSTSTTVLALNRSLLLFRVGSRVIERVLRECQPFCDCSQQLLKH